MMVPAQLFPLVLINELELALPLVGPERLFMAPSQLTNYPRFPFSIPPTAHPKLQSASSQDYTRGLQNISKQINLSLKDQNFYCNFFREIKIHGKMRK